MAKRKVHAYARGRWHPVQCIGATACGRETGRILGQAVGVRATFDRRKVTCMACLRVS